MVTPAMSIFLGSIFNVFISYGTGTLHEEKFMREITNASIYLVALGVASWLLYSSYFLTWIIFGELQARACRVHIFGQLERCHVEWFDRNNVANILSRFETQLRELQLATSQPLGIMFESMANILAALGVALYYSWDVTLVTLSTIPFVAIGSSYISSRLQVCMEAQQEALSDANSKVCNAFSAIDAVKCCNAWRSEVHKYSESIKTAATHFRRLAKLNATQIGFIRFIALSMSVQGFWYGSHLVLETTPQERGKVVANIITAFWSCLTAVQSVDQMIPQLLVLEKGKEVAKALQDIILDTSNCDSTSAQATPPSSDGTIRFRNVWFSYPTSPEAFVLQDFDCSIPSGRITFVIGESGSGKSTLGQLLVRFYSATSGSIEVNGQDLSTINLNWIRKNILLVQQDVTIFSGTILDNLFLGQDTVIEAIPVKIGTATEFSAIFNVIKTLPNYSVKKKGLKSASLSGGQRQLVALARARIRDPAILVLDEFSSALDQHKRRLVMRAVREWRKGKTTIIISHDLDLIEEHDLVRVIHNGRIVHEDDSRAVLEDSDYFRSQQEDPNESHRVVGGFGASPQHQNTWNHSIPSTSDAKQLSSPTLSDVAQQFRRRSATFAHIGFASIGRSFSLDLSPLSPVLPTNSPSTHPRGSTSDSETHQERQHLLPRRLDSDGMPQDKIRPERYHESTLQHALWTHRVNSMQVSPLPSPSCMRRARRILRRPSQGPEEQNIDRLDPTANEQGLSLHSILRTIWPALGNRARLFLCAGFFAAAIHAIGTPVFSYIFAQLIATFLKPQNASPVALKLSVSIFSLAIIDGLACFFMYYSLEYSGQIWVDTLRITAVRNILHQPKMFFLEESNGPTRLAQNLDRNPEETRNIVGRFLAFTFVALLMMVLVIVWSLVICWKLTLVGLSITPIAYAGNTLFSSITGKMESKGSEASAAAAYVLDETFTNVKTVRALTAERYFRNKYHAQTRNALRTGVKRAVLCGTLFGVTESLILFAISLMFYYGAVLASAGDYTVEDILLVLSLLLFGLGNLGAILEAVPQIQSSKDAATRLLRLTRLPPFSHEDNGSARITSLGPISFHNLSFAYPTNPSDPVLHDLSFTIHPGTCTAIVGHSGCGKSTIISLLLRLYEVPSPRDGRPPLLTIGGRDISRLHTPTLRNTIALVPQTPILLAASVAENIAYGLDSCTEDSIRAAAAAAGIDAFIAGLPSGYATRVGDGGLDVSGGQRQRIAIARALVRRPKVLLLDEATSALDVANAELVRETVRRLRREEPELTVVIATHEAPMMRLAERIVMLEGGRAVEEGGFDELMELGGRFAEMMHKDGVA